MGFYKMQNELLLLDIKHFILRRCVLHINNTAHTAQVHCQTLKWNNPVLHINFVV